MKQIDVVIVSFAKDQTLHEVTMGCIRSLRESGDCFDVIVVELNPEARYKCKTLYFEGEFNYNRCLNMGIKESANDLVTMCNNDVLFQHGWIESHQKVFQENPDIDSLSPLCPNFHERTPNCHKDFEPNRIYRGYRSRYELTGWCITVRRSIFDMIGELDTSVSFWCSDDCYARQLESQGLIHALDTGARVVHLFNKTLDTTSAEVRKKLTLDQAKLYENRNRVKLL